jgi:hypothetical protein
MTNRRLLRGLLILGNWRVKGKRARLPFGGNTELFRDETLGASATPGLPTSKRLPFVALRKSCGGEPAPPVPTNRHLNMANKRRRTTSNMSLGARAND